MSEKPFALHITWTCYGTWLPGDRRGHVSNTLGAVPGFIPKQNVPRTPYSAGDSYTRAQAHARQKDSTVLLTKEQALAAANALVDAAHRRGWIIVRAALMANHVHVLITDCPTDGEAVRRILKGNSQAALSDQLGHSRRWWTAGGSDRYKNDQVAIDTAIQYIASQEHKLVEIVDMEVRIIA